MLIDWRSTESVFSTLRNFSASVASVAFLLGEGVSASALAIRWHDATHLAGRFPRLDSTKMHSCPPRRQRLQGTLSASSHLVCDVEDDGSAARRRRSEGPLAR